MCAIIDNSAQLQYLIELGLLGYAEPINLRLDLTYEQKTQLLREHRARGASPSNVLTIEITPCSCLSNDSSKNYYTLCRGVYIEGFGPALTGITRHLELYQLPSWNRGTALKRWCHDLGMDASSVALDPDFNLLSIVEAQTLFVNAVADQIIFQVHLRTLDSNDAHPGAMFSKLSWAPDQERLRDYRQWDTRPLIVGNLLAVIFYNSIFGVNYLVVWDWTSGLMLLVSKRLDW
jgi:hypothetical protein